MKETTLKIIGTPTIIKNNNPHLTNPHLTNVSVIACEIYGHKEYPYMLKLTPSIYKEMLAELKKNNIEIDNNLNCLKDKIFTFAHKDWNTVPKELWIDEEIPTVLGITLRTDLCTTDTTTTTTG